MRYQQNLTNREIAIIVIGQQQWPRLRPHIDLVVNAVNRARKGSSFEVEIPDPKPGEEYSPGS